MRVALTMTQVDKLKVRFLSKPKDFTWTELTKFLMGLGYKETQAGKTSGSRVRFMHAEYEPITLHKPHPKPILKEYIIKQLTETLKKRGQL